MTASSGRESVSPLVTFVGDWPEGEREQMIQEVKQIERNASLPAPPEGWPPWHVTRISVKEKAFYVAHRWHLDDTPRSRSLEDLINKMVALVT